MDVEKHVEVEFESRNFQYSPRDISVVSGAIRSLYFDAEVSHVIAGVRTYIAALWDQRVVNVNAVTGKLGR